MALISHLKRKKERDGSQGLVQTVLSCKTDKRKKWQWQDFETECSKKREVRGLDRAWNELKFHLKFSAAKRNIKFTLATLLKIKPVETTEQLA